MWEGEAMTAIERAKQVVSDYSNVKAGDDFPLVHIIAAAITEAVQEERERCAKIADEQAHHLDQYQKDNQYFNGAWNAAINIAEAIRTQD